MATEELASFCFTPSTDLDAVRNSINFLLLPNERTFMRPDQRCMDVLTSTDRVKLLEKYLRLRYTMVEPETPDKKIVSLEEQNCQMEFKKTTENKTGLGNLNPVGVYNSGTAGTLNGPTTETSDLLLGVGKAGAITVDKQVIYVECRKADNGNYKLTFALTEKDEPSRISSDVIVKKNETVNVGRIKNDLNDKQKITGVGLPQTAVSTDVYLDQTTYELQVKN